MRASILVPILCSALNCVAQTGPGGVGTSANNVLWLRADAGVTQSSGAVSQWNDQSGNNNHALLPGTIPTATPTFLVSSVNNYPSLDFDGTDDQLWVTDHATIDLTQWHFFIVVTADVQKNYNAWMVKGDDSDENFEMLSYSDGNIHTPTKYSDNSRTFPSSASGQVVTGTFDIFEYSYSTAVGRDVYKNAGNIITDNENKTPKVNNLPLYIANESSTSGRNVDGDIAEVVAFNAPLNSAQRLIVNNYLAAKYARTLSSGDIYVQDNTGNGNYDHDVAGIGRVNSSNMQTDSRGSGIVEVSKAGYSGLGDDEFLIWGHDNGGLGTFGVGDLPTGVQGRWARVWRVNEVDASGSSLNVGNVDMTFDLAGLGPVSASDLRLLVDTDGDGLFADETPISGATLVSGTLYRFSNTSALQNGRRFTLGTANLGSTPLPIELVAFAAWPLGPRSVGLEWTTVSELNNDHFAVERSTNTETWEVVATLAGAGTSLTTTHYVAEDHTAPGGICYYRLRQTDLDGASTISDVVAVDLGHREADGPVIFPNPGTGVFNVLFPEQSGQPVQLTLFDPSGRIVATHREEQTLSVAFDTGTIDPGSYHLRIAYGAKDIVRTIELVP
ncbi:MAG: T9SS type A sorting domain-containing protein [Flavobacteriales bacterium]|nr:T9SS type A sorting domain-containing protein [Flavobacteriales bacterium]MBP6699175.1 T9SS type A sorting domain-containing protein [Flavobacteriales bacterium]